jgi:hypothetical protein
MNNPFVYVNDDFFILRFNFLEEVKNGESDGEYVTFYLPVGCQFKLLAPPLVHYVVSFVA